MENNKYILEWKNKVQEAVIYLSENNFKEYESRMSEANAAYEQYKRDFELTYECKSFGIAKYIFEDVLPNLLLSNNKKVIKEFTNTIKNDKNLKSQFQLFNTLSNYNDKYDINSYINESFELALNDIDKTTIKESNKKLDNLIQKYQLKPSDFIPNDKLRFFENCDMLLCKNKTLSNLTELNDRKNEVMNYVKLHQKIETPFEQRINEFTKKIDSVLTEEEKSFVQELIDFKSKGKEARKENLFNKYKNECLDLVNQLLKEEDENGENYIGLTNIKNQLNNKQFCLETLVQDMAKFLEIRDVLMSE